MKTPTRSILAGLAVAALLVVSSAAVVTAASPAVAGGPAGKGICVVQATAVKAGVSIETLRAFGDCEVARRYTTLDKLSGRISSSKVLTSSDAAALSSEVASTKSGLVSLKAQIDAESSLDALKAEVRRIATDFRVYLLVVPQVNLVNGADAVQAAKAKFDDVSTKLTARIAAAKAAGKDTTAAQADLDAMNAAVAQAVGLAKPLPGALLPLTPAQYNAGTAGPVLKNSRAALVQARGLLQSARKDAQACRDALK
ncbi:MAG: hypothetical protein ABSD62_02655 [Candidatus Limnocylindrales bacterium]|jgi:hypothetical protein